MSQTKNTANLLWGAVALGALGVLGSYVAAGPERFWANWILLVRLPLHPGPGLAVHRGPRAPGQRQVERAHPAHPRAPGHRSCIPAVPIGLIALAALPVLYPWHPARGGAEPAPGRQGLLAEPALLLRAHGDLPSPSASLASGCWWAVRSGRTRPRIPPSTSGPASSRRPSWPSSPSWSRSWPSTGSPASTPEWYSDIFGVYLFAGRLPRRAWRPRPWRSCTCRTQGRLRGRARRPPLQPGRLPLRLHGVLVLHRLRPVHAHVVREPAGRGRLVQGAPPGCLALRHARSWRCLHFVLPFFALVTRDAKRRSPAPAPGGAT